MDSRKHFPAKSPVAGLADAVRNFKPRRAIVYGLGRENVDEAVHYNDGLDLEAEIVSMIGNANSDVAFVRFDGETVTRCRRIRRIL